MIRIRILGAVKKFGVEQSQSLAWAVVAAKGPVEKLKNAQFSVLTDLAPSPQNNSGYIHHHEMLLSNSQLLRIAIPFSAGSLAISLRTGDDMAMPPIRLSPSLVRRWVSGRSWTSQFERRKKNEGFLQWTINILSHFNIS